MSLSEAVAQCVKNPDVLDKVQSSYALVSVRVSYWRGRPKVRNASVTVDGHTVNKESTSAPSWLLIPPTEHAKLKALDQQVKALLDLYALPAQLFSKSDDDSDDGRSVKLPSVRLVLASKLEELFGRLGILSLSMDSLAEEICKPDSHAKIVKYVREQEKDSTIANEKANLIPPPEQMRKSFGIRKTVLPTAIPAGISNNPNSFFAKVAQESLLQQAAQNFETIIREPRIAISEASSVMLGHLAQNSVDGIKPKEDRVLKGTYVKAFTKALETFDNKKEVADDQLIKDVNTTKSNLLQVMSDADNSGIKGYENDSLTAVYLARNDIATESLIHNLANVVRSANDESAMVSVVEKISKLATTISLNDTTLSEV